MKQGKSFNFLEMSDYIAGNSFSRLGPAFMVYVGCMDPGIWATAMGAGSRLGFELVWVLLSACAFSGLLQSLSTRLGLATGKNLAQICGDEYPRYLSMILLFLCEASVLVKDLSMVLGVAIIFNSFLGLSMMSSVIVAAAVSIIFLLFLSQLGLYKTAFLISSIMGVVLLSFTAETLYANILSAPAALQGLLPMFRGEIVYIAAGILGSNIVPTNIYLQSALFDNRNFQDCQKSALSLRYSFIGICAASGILFLVLLAVLSSAATAFHNSSHGVIILQDAHALMEQVLCSSVPPVVFGFAFICASQISTLSRTMAGQVVAQGLLGLKLPFTLHHIFTRVVATITALFVVQSFGSDGVYQILIFLQVILTLQLPFVIVPLVKITSSEIIMGSFKNSLLLETISWICCGVIYVLDVWLIFDMFFGEYDEYVVSGSWNFLRDLVELSTQWGDGVRFLCHITIVGLATLSTLLLMWIISSPFKVECKKQLMRSVSAPVESTPDICDGNSVEGIRGKKTFQEFDHHNDRISTDLAKNDCSEGLEADKQLDYEISDDVGNVSTAKFESDKQLADDPGNISTTRIEPEKMLVYELADDPGNMSTRYEFANDPDNTSLTKIEEVHPEDIQLDSAENSGTQQESYIEAKAGSSAYSNDNPAFLLCNHGKETLSQTSIEEVIVSIDSTTSDEPFPSVNSSSTTLIPSSVALPELNSNDSGDAGKSDVNCQDVEPAKQPDDELDCNELLDKDDDYIDGWESLEQCDAFQGTHFILGDSANSSTLEERQSEISFNARSDASEGGCGSSGSGSGSGSLSRLSGLGRSARRQFSGLLDEFWGKLFDLHGQTVALAQGKPRLPSAKNSQGDALGYNPVAGYNDTFGDWHASKQAQQSSRKDAVGDLFGPSLHYSYPNSSSESLSSLYIQSHSSHNRQERRYSSLNFPSSRNSVVYQPRTIHGYKIASYAERSRAFSTGADVNPFMVEKQVPMLNEQTSRATTFNRLQLSSSSSFENNAASQSGQLGFPGPYAKQRLYENPSLASHSSHNQPELLDMSRKDHSFPCSRRDASVWDPLVYRVTGELDIPQNDFKIMQLGGKDIVNPSGVQKPVGKGGFFGINVSGTENVKAQVEKAPLSFDERAPLSFDEISPSQSWRDAFSTQSSSLWSTQPFEQLFGSSQSSTVVSPCTTNMTLSQSRRFSSSTLANHHNIGILIALRICIRKLLKLEGSDWLFRFETGFDEDLIGTVAMREKVLLNADAKNHYKMQSTNEQFLVSASKQLAKSEFDPALSASSVPCCGEQCVWNMELVISFGVWCMHRILELALMESRPELWGKYTYVLNRLQGILDPAFSKPRTISTSCICLVSEYADLLERDSMQGNLQETGFSSSPSQSWPCGRHSSTPKGKGASASMFLDIIRVVETAISSRKGRTGTAAGDVAFPKGKENLASVLKRYKRRLSSKTVGTSGYANNGSSNDNASSGVLNNKTGAVNPLFCRP